MRSSATFLTFLAAMSLAAGAASAQCGSYDIGSSPNSYEGGESDIGSHCDDCIMNVALPFPVSVYGVSYNAINLSSNGSAQFVSASAAYSNTCPLPSGTFLGGPTILPHWDDLMTTAGGIYTSLSGAPGSQRFNIEWRVGYFPSTTVVATFALSFYENQSFFDIFYQSIPNNGASASIGVQVDGAAGASATTYSCNTSTALTGAAHRYSYNPTGTGTPNVASAGVDSTCVAIGQSVTITAQVTASQCPPTPVSSVSANAAAIDAGTVTLADQGGGFWAGSAIVGPNATGGAIVVTATASNGTSASGSTPGISINAADPIGDLPSTAFVMSGDGSALASITGNLGANCANGNDADMYQVYLCDPANFSVSLCSTAAFDTQLFLFDENGLGIASRDDSCGLQSTLSNLFTAGRSPGIVYIAISGYNMDPVDEGGQLIWISTPFGVERSPDGPGAAGQVSSWFGAGGGGDFTMSLTGVCTVAGGGGCDPDFNQDGVADQDDVAYLRNVVAGGENPTGRDPDFNQDGVADQDDVAALINVIAGGECP